MKSYRHAAIVISLLILFFYEFAQANTFNAIVTCKNTISCNKLGTQAFRKGDTASAIHLFKQEVGYAEDAKNMSESSVAYNNLAATYMRLQKYFYALAWASLALRANPGNTAAKHNITEIKIHTMKYHWPTLIGGSYVQYAGRTYWSSLHISKKAGKIIDFSLIIYRWGTASRKYGPSSLGYLKGKAALIGSDEARYVGSDDFPNCQVDMKFDSASVNLTQQGNCGFGFEVRAIGRYGRINAKDDANINEHNLP